MNPRHPLAIALLALFPAAGLASDQIGTLARVEGDVKILSHPSQTIQENLAGTHVLYEGSYFVVNDAKLGDAVDQGNVIRTTPTGKARILYGNGDQLTLGHGTSFKVAWTDDGHIEISLGYGKVRGIVQKGGPRSKLTIRTRTAVMGVRGTDFFVTAGTDLEGTRVTVMRGEVAVAKPAPDSPQEAVKPGFTADVDSGPTIHVALSTQELLAATQKVSTVAKPSQQPPPALAALEDRAGQMVLEDVKLADPLLYAEIEKNPAHSVDDINLQAVRSLYQTAPKAAGSATVAPPANDEDLDTAYDTFFKKAE